jgi:hypothetical protein
VGEGGRGAGKVFIFAYGAMGKKCDSIVIPTLQTAAMLCEDSLYMKIVMVQPRHRLTPVARCFTDLSLPNPLKTPSKPPSNRLTKPLSNKLTNIVN